MVHDLACSIGLWCACKVGRAPKKRKIFGAFLNEPFLLLHR